LEDCDAVLSSFRPGGFAARVLDERIPLKHGVIGQETQGPGGFFMALRAVNVLQGVLGDIERVCPKAKVFNYTNPVNILAQAVTQHSDIPFISLCEGPIYYRDQIAQSAELDNERLDAWIIGLNHASWSVRHLYDGADAMPLIAAAWERREGDPTLTDKYRRQLRIAAAMGAIPSEYFQYYYCVDEVLAELEAKPTTRAEDIMSWAPDYWNHYAEQAKSDDPTLDPDRSRGGIHELELAIDMMDAVFNDKDEVHPVNVPNANGALPGFEDGLVVEVQGRTVNGWVEALPAPAPLPRHLTGLIEMLAEYQVLAAEAAWSGTRIDGVRALAANPLVLSLDKAETIYDELAAAHRAYLPERLLA
ncbi:MAG: glycoside hydrolase, partial [Gaiellales bacterium]